MKKGYTRGKNHAKKKIVFASHSVHLAYTIALPRRAELVARRLHLLVTIFGELFADENFLTLLRAESMTMLPAHLYSLLERRNPCR